MTNEQPLTLEAVIKAFKGLQHQVAALPLLEADIRENGYKVAMQRSRTWYGMFSPPSEKGNAAAPYLRLTRTKQIDNRGLVVLLLERFKNNVPMASMKVVSGAPGAQKQAFRKGVDSRSGSSEPLPEGLWELGPVLWAAAPENFSASWGPGLGPATVPLTFKGPGSTARSAIEAHYDSNHGASPGTAGCMGFNSIDDLKTFIYWLRSDHPKHLYVDWGLGSCPKPA